MADTTEKTVASELREAMDRLSPDSPVHAPGRARVLGDQTSGSYSFVMIAICDYHDNPADLPANLDRDGCCGNCIFVKTYDRDLARQLVGLINAREPLASWLDLEAGRYDEDVYEDEIGCNPGGTDGDFCEADCPGHKLVAICDQCRNRVGPDASEGRGRCGCWDKALAVAHALNGITERSTS